MQYIVAVPLIFGRLTADDYEDAVAADPRIDALRAKMVVQEDPRYSREYLELDKRSIANAVQVFFRDGTSTRRVEVEYPLGHRRRRREGIPLLVQKFRDAMLTLYSPRRGRRPGRAVPRPRSAWSGRSVPELMAKLVRRALTANHESTPGSSCHHADRSAPRGRYPPRD